MFSCHLNYLETLAKSSKNLYFALENLANISKNF